MICYGRACNSNSNSNLWEGDVKSKSYHEPIAITKFCNLYHRWDKPILLAWGLSDKYLPQSVAEQFQKGNPAQIQLKLIEGAGHMPQEDW